MSTSALKRCVLTNLRRSSPTQAARCNLRNCTGHIDPEHEMLVNVGGHRRRSDDIFCPLRQRSVGLAEGMSIRHSGAVFDCRQPASVAHTDELSSFRFPAQIRHGASRQTSVSPGGAGSSKGQYSSGSLAAKNWSTREIKLRRSDRLSHERVAPRWPRGMGTTAHSWRLVSCVGHDRRK